MLKKWLLLGTATFILAKEKGGGREGRKEGQTDKEEGRTGRKRGKKGNSMSHRKGSS